MLGVVLHAFDAAMSSPMWLLYQWIVIATTIIWSSFPPTLRKYKRLFVWRGYQMSSLSWVRSPKHMYASPRTVRKYQNIEYRVCYDRTTFVGMLGLVFYASTLNVLRSCLYTESVRPLLSNGCSLARVAAIYGKNQGFPSRAVLCLR